MEHYIKVSCFYFINGFINLPNMMLINIILYLFKLISILLFKLPMYKTFEIPTVRCLLKYGSQVQFPESAHFISLKAGCAIKGWCRN